MVNPIEEVGKTARNLFAVLKDQPLVLMMGLMNLLLVGYMFYYTNGVLNQRSVTTDQIIKWQQETDKIMSSCVSKEVIETIVGALERQLSEMRRQLDGHAPEPVPAPRPRPEEQR